MATTTFAATPLGFALAVDVDVGVVVDLVVLVSDPAVTSAGSTTTVVAGIDAATLVTASARDGFASER
jgi:hypothetical protein